MEKPLHLCPNFLFSKMYPTFNPIPRGKWGNAGSAFSKVVNEVNVQYLLAISMS